MTAEPIAIGGIGLELQQRWPLEFSLQAAFANFQPKATVFFPSCPNRLPQNTSVAACL